MFYRKSYQFLVFLFLIMFMGCSLCGCDDEVANEEGNSGATTAAAVVPQKKSGAEAGKQAGAAQKTGGEGELKFCCSPYSDSACYTEDGYYYFCNDETKLKGGEYGGHLMYMDYATCQEVYLCSTAGCRHDTLDCPAVLSAEDFPISTTKLFVFKDNLYILGRESDQDGSVTTMEITEKYEPITPESKPAVLYCAELDGTNRKKIFTFEADLTLEERVIQDENGIYVVTKKNQQKKEGNQLYEVSSERRLMFLDLASMELKEICPMTFDDDIKWEIDECYGDDSLILSGHDYGRKLTREEEEDKDAYIDIFNKSSKVFAILNLKSGKRKEFYRMANKDEYSYNYIGGTMYTSISDSKDIMAVDIKTGKKKRICSLADNQIMYKVGDTLWCCGWDLEKDKTYYFVNTKTGKVSHSTLVNKCNGWALEIRAYNASDILVVYDYDATKNADDSYEIRQYKCALISKEDLYAGREKYRKIKMIGSGE